VGEDGAEGPGLGGERPRRHAKRPAEMLGGPGGRDGGPSGIATDALWVCDDAAAYPSRGGGDGSSVMATGRDRGDAVCETATRTRSATQSVGGLCDGGEQSGAMSVRRVQGGAKWRSRRSRGETDTGGTEHTRGK
jgi:hypothetical protein